MTCPMRYVHMQPDQPTLPVYQELLYRHNVNTADTWGLGHTGFMHYFQKH